MRNNTKESRLRSRQVQFDSLLKAGYSQETYKGVDFFTNMNGKYFTLKVFHGTAANHTEYVNYRSEERRNEVIQNYKDNWDRNQQYKAELKANPKKSSAANCAAAIRTELKTAFPGIKFSVTCENFSMGDSVDIRWEDGPTTKEVEEFTSKYQYGHFDSMTDMYESSNSRDDIPQSKYVHTNRQLSEELKAKLMVDAERLFVEDRYTGVRDASNFLYRVFQACSILPGAIVTGIERNEKTCGVSVPEEFYRIAYTIEGQETKTQQVEIEKQEITPGEIQIIEYGKGIAVIGDTYPIRHKLGKQGLRGIFQPKLSCGAGWIFPKSRLEEVTKALSEPTEPEPTKVIEMIESPVKQYDNLEDITAAANSGEVISLANLCSIVNHK